MKNKSIRGIEEIRNELGSIKDEIEKKKIDSDKKVDEFIADLETSVDNIEQQIDQKVGGIESEIRQNLNVASTSSKTFLDTLSHHRKVTRAAFRSILLVFFVFLSGLIVLGVPSNEARILLFTTLIVAFSLIYYSIKETIELNSKNMENALNPFSADLSLKDLVTPKIPLEKMPRLDKLRQVFGGVLASISKVIPGVNNAYTELTLLAKFGKKVKEFKSTLEHYNIKLISDPPFFDNLEKYAPAEARIIDDESLWEEIIVKKITSELEHSQPNISNDVISLLYKEHNDRDTQNTFRKIKEDEKELKNLANIIFDSGRLTKPPGNLNYDVEDVHVLLKNFEDFDLSQANNLLSIALRQLDYIQSYRDFLLKNGIKVDIAPTIKFVLEKVDKNVNSFEGQVIDLAYKFGQNCYKNILSSRDLTDGFARASVSIKFNSEISLRKIACELSSNHVAVAVIRAYQEKKKERGGEFVTLEDLVKDLDLINSIIKKRNEIDFKFLESELKEGKWYDSTSDYLKAMIENMKKELKTQIEKVEKFIILKDAVRKTFEEVKIGTIEKAIDAQVFSAYLIMSSASSGELAPLIDTLSLRDLEKPEERRWEWKDNSTTDRIKKQYGVKPRYDFMKYSHSTWVGILKRGEPFTEFKNNFLEDLKKVLEKEKKILEKTGRKFNIGLVIQRITPSKYSFGILDDVPEDINIKDLEIARYVAKLASDHISEEEQASVMTFDRDVDLLKILDTKSIFELIRVENDDITGKESKTLESDSLKKEVLSELKTRLEVKSFKSLALDLAGNAIPENSVLDVLASVFSKNNLRRANTFSKRLVNILKELAVLYELQHR